MIKNQDKEINHLKKKSSPLTKTPILTEIDIQTQ